MVLRSLVVDDRGANLPSKVLHSCEGQRYAPKVCTQVYSCREQRNKDVKHRITKLQGT
jgi:hypothetical protein